MSWNKVVKEQQNSEEYGKLIKKHLLLHLACNFTKKLTRPQVFFKDFPLDFETIYFLEQFLVAGSE